MDIKTQEKIENPNTTKGNYYFSAIYAEFAHFLHVVITPVSLICLILIVVLTVFLPSQTSVLQTIFTILVTLLSGFVGAIWYDRYKKSYETGFITKKSYSSIRNLKLIKSKISEILTRLKDLRTKDNVRDMDELESHIRNIDKDILNSISDWEDVNPESTELIRAYEEMDLKEKQIIQLQKDTDEIISKKDKETIEVKKDMEKQVTNKNQEIQRLRKQISTIESNSLSLGTVSPQYTTASGVSLSNTPYLSINNSYTCIKCGRSYTPTLLSSINNGLCNNCNNPLNIMGN